MVCIRTWALGLDLQPASWEILNILRYLSKCESGPQGHLKIRDLYIQQMFTRHSNIPDTGNKALNKMNKNPSTHRLSEG